MCGQPRAQARTCGQPHVRPASTGCAALAIATSVTPMRQDPLDVTRGLLNQDAVARRGFLDVLGESKEAPAPTVAQRAMNSPFFVTVYERVWRPTSFYVASGVTAGAEQRRAAA